MVSEQSANIIHGGGFTSRQASLLWMLSVAVEREMPLADEVEALAVDARGRYRRGLRDLADMLRAGIPFPEAVESLPGLVSPQAAFAIRVGCETGTLAQALRSAAVNLSANRRQEFLLSYMWIAFYAFSLLNVIFLVVSFVMYWIIPKFKMIFDDFGTELPDITIFVIDVADVFVAYFPVFLPLFLGIMYLTFYVFTRSIFGWKRFRVKILAPRRLFPRLETSSILRCLALVIDAGKPIADAIMVSAYWYPQPALRKKLALINVAVHHAEDCFASLNQNQIITKTEEKLLRAAEKTGNLSWALRHIADNLDRRFWYRFRLLGELIQPVFFMILGGIVLVISVGFFMPLVSLLHDLS